VTEAQLRIYTIKPGELDEWLSEWAAHVAPLRRRFGFEVVGPWVDEDSRTFVWLLEYGGEDGLEAANARYYDSPERRALDPDPARHLEKVETRLLRRVQ
jgi:hypothetical protein